MVRTLGVFTDVVWVQSLDRRLRTDTFSGLGRVRVGQAWCLGRGIYRDIHSPGLSLCLSFSLEHDT